MWQCCSPAARAVRLYALDQQYSQAGRAVRRKVSGSSISRCLTASIRGSIRSGVLNPVSASGPQRVYRQRPAVGSRPEFRRRARIVAVSEERRSPLGMKARPMPIYQNLNFIKMYNPGICPHSVRRSYLSNGLQRDAQSAYRQCKLTARSRQSKCR